MLIHFLVHPTNTYQALTTFKVNMLDDDDVQVKKTWRTKRVGKKAGSNFTKDIHKEKNMLGLLYQDSKHE